MKSLYDLICPHCNHRLQFHVVGHCSAKWKHVRAPGESYSLKFHTCKCEHGHVGLLLEIIDTLHESIVKVMEYADTEMGEWSGVSFSHLPNNMTSLHQIVELCAEGLARLEGAE